MFDIASAVITAGAKLFEGHKQRKSDRKALQEQNEYNSPANQMRRLQEAGLNPNLVYGGGNVTGNQSGLLKQDYSSYSDATNNALTYYMAIDNHDKDMEMKAKQIQAQENANRLFEATFEYQKQKTMMEDKILKARLRMEEAQANILNHDWDVIKNRNFTTSKDGSSTGLADVLAGKLYNWLDR